MASTSSIFTGSSQFSQDFQSIISRAAAIASLPINLLNADKTSLTGQATALSGLDGRFAAVQSAIEGVEAALDGGSFQAEISDNSKVAVSLGTGAMEGSYTIDVLDPGTYATSMTASNWETGTGAVRSYRLAIGGQTFDLSPADTTAAGVAAAINSQYGDMVHATVVNVGSASAPDYRISLKATRLGDLKPEILTGPAAPTSLQEQKTGGSDTLATSQTAQAWDANPALTFQLSLDGQSYAITPDDNSAAGVAAAITRDYGDRVAATVVNVGTEESPDFRITLSAAKPGNLRPDILASDGFSDAVSLQAQQAEGSDTRSVSETARTWDAGIGPLTYQLSIGGVNYDLSPAGNTAAAVVADINAKYGDKVQAAVVDVGTPAAHDYRIRLTAIEAGDLKPDLIVSEAKLQKQQATGSAARYIVNDSGKEVVSDTRTVSVADGVTITLLARTSDPVNVTVARSTAVLATALTGFANAYNAAVDELDKQHGSTPGALAGQSIVSRLARVLSGVSTYASAAGSISGLADLGLDLDKTGHLSFNSSTLTGADQLNPAGVTSFLGSSGKGGFLKVASDSLKEVEDSTAGLLATSRKSVESQIESVAGRINQYQARVDDMTERLQAQMAATDALIASMEQQYNYLYGMFQSMQAASKQYG